MKLLMIALVIACYSLIMTAIVINEQMNDYKKASNCIAEYIALGIARSDLEINGATCQVIPR